MSGDAPGGTTRSDDAAGEPARIDVSALERNAERRVLGSATLEDLRNAEIELLGKRSEIAQANSRLGSLEPAERREAGRLLGEVRAQIEALFKERRAVLDTERRRSILEDDRLDLTELCDPSGTGLGSIGSIGHLHLVQRTRDELEDVFLGMGFAIADGPEVETDWYNFEALNIPPAHPARGMWDTFYLDVGEPGTVLLRTHTSPVQIRLMQSQQPPVYAVMPGRCYRRDTPDARHTPIFHQVEGLVVDRDISFGDLAGTIETFTGRVRRRHPFAVAPCVLPFHGAVCGVRDHLHHLPGGGLPYLFPDRMGRARRLRNGRPCSVRCGGCRPGAMDGIRIRIGIDRCAQMRHAIPDMRVMLENDVRVLLQA